MCEKLTLSLEITSPAQTKAGLWGLQQKTRDKRTPRGAFSVQHRSLHPRHGRGETHREHHGATSNRGRASPTSTPEHNSLMQHSQYFWVVHSSYLLQVREAWRESNRAEQCPSHCIGAALAEKGLS